MSQTRCNTCCRSASDPYRRIDAAGRIIEGCVDACHGPHLVRPSNSAQWHDRPQAKQCRRMNADRRKAILAK